LILVNNGTASGDSELKTAGFVGSHQDRLWHKDREALTYSNGLPVFEVPVRRRTPSRAARAALVIWADPPRSMTGDYGQVSDRTR
jgi:hypothetical protein